MESLISESARDQNIKNKTMDTLFSVGKGLEVWSRVQ